jgi:perosamine synthetase
MNIRLFKPSVGKEELAELRKVIDLSWLGLGEKVNEFEDSWSKKFNFKSSIGVNSATAALHMALASFNFKRGSEVLVPSMTFASTATSVLYNGLKPIFVDIDPNTMVIDNHDLLKKITSKSVGIIPVHYGGEPCKMDEIISIASDKNLKVIEDCAHTQGGKYLGKELGRWGDIGCYSFEEKKGMTTGDGGMLCSDDVELIKPIKSMRWVGIDKDTWKRKVNDTKLSSKHWFYEISLLGYKYNMNNVAAAIGIAQLKKLDLFNFNKTNIIKAYLSGLENIKGIDALLPYSNIQDGVGSYWLFGVKLKKRDQLISFLSKKGISTGVHFTPLNQQPLFYDAYGTTPKAESMYKKICTLPLHPDLKEEEVCYVLEALSTFSNKYL